MTIHFLTRFSQHSIQTQSLNRGTYKKRKHISIKQQTAFFTHKNRKKVREREREREGERERERGRERYISVYITVCIYQ